MASSCVTRVAAAVPQISASAVAASIDKHPYQDADSAMLRVLLRDPTWRSVVEELKREHGLHTPSDALDEACASVPSLADVVRAGVDAAVGATTDACIAAAVQHAVTQAAALPLPPDLIKPDVIEAAITQSINMSRGTVLEAKALNEFETARGVTVGERNARSMCLDTGEYVIWGRIDGYDAERHCVVEAKNRMRVWPTVPPYDLIQLRVYLKLVSRAMPTLPPPRGTLLERFPDGTTRVTDVEHDDAEWEALHADILKHVVAPFKAMTRERALDILRAAACAPPRPSKKRARKKE